jgi:hypothetical protein
MGYNMVQLLLKFDITVSDRRLKMTKTLWIIVLLMAGNLWAIEPDHSWCETKKDANGKYYAVYVDYSIKLDVEQCASKETAKEALDCCRYAELKGEIKGILFHSLDINEILSYLSMSDQQGLTEHDKELLEKAISKMEEKELEQARGFHKLIGDAYVGSDYFKTFQENLEKQLNIKR